MNRLIRTFLLAACLFSVVVRAFAQPLSTPLEFRQSQIPYNLQSPDGVPISTNQTDLGSNGQMPTSNASGSVFQPTGLGPDGVVSNQFQSFISFGAIPGLTSNAWQTLSTNALLQGTTAFSGPVAVAMGLPVGYSNSVDRSGGVAITLRRGQIGAPYLSRQVSFPFGAIVQVPDTDENGVLLESSPASYWFVEPHIISGQTNSGYYWSPHSRQVYASQSGPIKVTWRKRAYTSALPADYTNSVSGVTNYFTDSLGNYYRLFTVDYIVSGSPVKPVQKMYWTEKSFSNLGKPVSVPSARVGAVVIAYNNNFPATVTDQYVAPGETPPGGTTNQVLGELRTLWYDDLQDAILAYNREGRVFMELLGDPRPDGETREPLGFEIVDVAKYPNPLDVTSELGELIEPPKVGDWQSLTPEPVLQAGGQTFAYQQFLAGSSQVNLYATRETANLNDYLVHWMTEGEASLKWPKLFGRYRMVWPPDATKYSHYVRPLVATEEEAKATAVLLPTANAPTIEYQDPLDQIRGKLTENFAYYSFLTPQYPAHRALLRFSTGEDVAFERVFSWLDQTLITTNLAGSVATDLTSVSDYLDHPDLFSTPWPDQFNMPRVVNQTVEVGARINAPGGEVGNADGEDYLAGHLNLSAGTLFNVNAYVDPFASGFESANEGAIIPVNAIPGENHLEVWWFRTSTTNAGANTGNAAVGFLPNYWPSVIGRYTVAWPTNSSEIVLASNDGSGALPSWQAVGTVYVQNDATQPGYNPNEEHALMQGGQAYALRDDLNVTANGYSSEPFVLLEFTDLDGRPGMRPFRVLREKGGVRFNYQVEAGAILQPPMPLPLLEKPLAPSLSGGPPRSLNQEVFYRTVAASTANGDFTTVEPAKFRPFFRELALQSPDFTTNYWLMVTNALYASNLLSGAVSELPAFLPTFSSAATGTVTSIQSLNRTTITNVDVLYETVTIEATASRTVSLEVTPPLSPLTTGQTVYVVAPSLGLTWSAQFLGTNVLQTNQLLFDYSTTAELSRTTKLALGQTGTAPSPDPGELEELLSEASLIQGTRLFLPVTNLSDGQFDGWQLRTEPVPGSLDPDDAQFTLQDRKGNLWIYRGPHDEQDTPYMTMQFYYKTLPGFYFPSLAFNAQPPAGIITPYLRTRDTTGAFVGNAVYGDAGIDGVGDDNALEVGYGPVWPESAPVLQMAETLTLPKRGLPSIRGESSLQILYQQSQISDTNKPVTVRLHDPTRDKEFELGPPDGSAGLGRIPDSVATSDYRGNTFFPNLPPHLSERFFLDPNRGPHGKLVFSGEFVDDLTGDKYLLLNVLSPKELATLKALCLVDDPAYGDWASAIDGLETTLEHFVEAPQQPGTFVPGTTAIKGPAELAEIWDDDVAVDSYALTATGPGTGYVTLVAGNGLAFTPSEEPVSVKVVRVVETLYPGEVKVILSSNPLAEKVTMQQVVDLAGETGDYAFEWKIASPVDGAPPDVYTTIPQTLLEGGLWSHIQFPLPGDQPATLGQTAEDRVDPASVANSVRAVSRITFTGFVTNDDKLEFTLSDLPHRLAIGNQLTVWGIEPAAPTLIRPFPGTVVGTTPTTVLVALENPAITLASLALFERVQAGQPQSFLFRDFTVSSGTNTLFSELWLSLDLDEFLGVRVYLDGELVVTANRDVGNTPTDNAPGYISPLPKAYRLDPSILDRAIGDGTHQLAVELFSSAQGPVDQTFDLKIEAVAATDLTGTGNGWLPLPVTQYEDGVRAIIGETADVRSLSDNYLIMRYLATSENHASFDSGWSRWTTPKLAEGWIKRVLAGINPFNQRLTDLFNNQVDTDASLLTQAGRRYEGDVALNLDSINDYGLIEIYETVLRRGRLISIDGGINYGPANDALLLAAGYLNDLYLLLGNEAWADAANPTIGIGTADNTYGDIATALFAFKGQMPTVLEEELALLRGRDDFLQPGVEVPPFYNRLVWNYTRGIDSGEAIYALNYNILENPDLEPDGIIDAEDAAHMFPQAHGDAYGHYLTALKGYYSLLMNSKFDWVPRIEAVNVLGQPVAVDYQDERKFASAATAVARAGRQVFDLTWRKDYRSVSTEGWAHMSPTRENTGRRVPVTRHWGMDQWASRTGQGNYINWVVGNSMLPAVDPDPTHEGIQKVDRTTVPELKELATLAGSLQTALDNAEGGLSPLGVPEGGLAFDINPNEVVGPDGGSHFEQIYERAKATLNNAVAAFDDAKDVTRLMRSEQDSLADLQNRVVNQELAYRNALIELYGSPYPDDMAPGRTYKQDYEGPDTLHYMYVETPEITFPGLWNYPGDTTEGYTYKIDVTDLPKNWGTDISYTDFERTGPGEWDVEDSNFGAAYTNGAYFIEYHVGPHGYFEKPPEWTSRRASPGKIQQAISEQIAAHTRLSQALWDQLAAKATLDRNISLFKAEIETYEDVRDLQEDLLIAEQVLEAAQLADAAIRKALSLQRSIADNAQEVLTKALPDVLIVGFSNGGDLTAAAQSAIAGAKAVTETSSLSLDLAAFIALKGFETATAAARRWIEFYDIEELNRDENLRTAMAEIGTQFEGMQEQLWGINLRLREYDQAQRNVRATLAEADRVLEEREIYRKRAAALVQGYRTRDAAFRIFRNEKLERYKTLFDLSARYALLAANAYDYETGLLDTSAGRDFTGRIISARALGVVQDGEPQFAGSNTGDPGLSSVLAEMKADWEVLRGRLGINNPDAYGTTVSLRTEHFRILPDASGSNNWVQILQQARKRDLLEDADVRRYCLQISNGDGLPVPGIILTFSTTISDGYNLFGRPLAAGDHAFSPSSFVTKIFGTGIAFEGYLGMDNPDANSGTGGTSPPDPDLSYLDPQALAATPYVYLIPVGSDSMRSPALGDTSEIRTWGVQDLAIPLPFNIGASDFSTAGLYQSSDSLTEPLFAVRKHQAFRPVSSTAYFDTTLYGEFGTLIRSEYTNNRLVGRSVWNSEWKLVIPGKTLLANPEEGLERFIQTVHDIELHFVTYSYSGN